MKKNIKQIFLVGLLIFLVSTNVFADYSTLFIDGRLHFYWADSSQDRFNWYSVDYEYVNETNSNKLNIEYLHPLDDSAVKGLLVKNGFIVNEDDISILYGNFSVMHLNVNSAGIDKSYLPLLLGLETKYYIDERSYIDGSIDFTFPGLGGNLFNSGFRVAKIKLISLCTPNMGITFGYNWTEMEIKDNDINIKTNDAGLNLGMFYLF